MAPRIALLAVLAAAMMFADRASAGPAARGQVEDAARGAGTSELPSRGPMSTDEGCRVRKQTVVACARRVEQAGASISQLQRCEQMAQQWRRDCGR
jgi:hypothetical protein